MTGLWAGNYIVAMLIDIIPIGNSKGIRIPKVILEQYGLTDKADLILEEGRLILQAPAKPRQGWEEAAQEMAARGDDSLLLPESSLSRFDEEDWVW